jgi:hypothetical protein
MSSRCFRKDSLGMKRGLERLPQRIPDALLKKSQAKFLSLYFCKFRGCVLLCVVFRGQTMLRRRGTGIPAAPTSIPLYPDISIS